MNSTEKRSTLGRGFQLGRLGLNLVGSYLGYQAQNLLLGEGERTERIIEYLDPESTHKNALAVVANVTPEQKKRVQDILSKVR